MTIEEAIELLEHYVKSGQIEDTPESLRFFNGNREDAVKLGIEALKSVQNRRNSPALLVGAGAFRLLPGETEK